jgi:hypothetical protein
MNIPTSWRSSLVFLVTLLAWEGLSAGRATAVTILDACLQLQNDPALQDQLGIRNVKWIQAGTSDVTYLGGQVPVPTSHCYILTEARGSASYNPDGSVAAFNERGHVPAIEILRVPQCYGYDGSSVLNIFVGGQSDQTGSQMELPALHPFLGAHGLAGLECRAFAFSKNFPTISSPFCVANPDVCPVAFLPSYSPQDLRLNTLVLGRRTRELLMIFGGVKIHVGVGLSLGGIGAISLIGDVVDNPFTATGTRAGAGGVWEFAEENRKICMDPSSRIPLLGVPLPPGFCSVESMARDIALADPDYARLILDLFPSDPDGAKALINAYNVSDRPIRVQLDAEQLTAGGNLQVPLIIVQGTADMAVFPHTAILAWRKIMRSGKTSMARLYFLKGLTHTLGPPTAAAVRNHLQFFKAAVNLAETGIAPGPLTIVRGTTTFDAFHCTALGFEFEPCKCWDAVVQSTDPALQCSPGGIDKY